ncbi:hypothetical protein RKD49_007907 [Streptomyces glaucescens]
MEESTLPPDCPRILSVVRQAAGPVMAPREDGEAVGVDIACTSSP